MREKKKKDPSYPQTWNRITEHHPDAKVMWYKNTGMIRGKSGAGSRGNVITRAETEDWKVRQTNSK